MSRKYLVLIIISFSLVFTSCVSKKKFLEMQNGRLKAEELSRQLDEKNQAKAARIVALIEDFESMKNELMESNAIKDHYIDSLNSAIYVLSDNLNQQKESLQETSFNLDFEKQRLTDALKSKDKSIGSLRSSIEQLESTIAAKNSVIEQKNFDIKQSEEQSSLLEGKIKSGESKLLDLQNQLQKVMNETGKLKVQIKEKDAAIQRLENNVKLLKSELGK